MPAPRLSKELSSELSPVPKTVDALLAEAEEYGLLGTSTSAGRREKLRQPRGKLIGSVYQSWKVGSVSLFVFC